MNVSSINLVGESAEESISVPDERKGNLQLTKQIGEKPDWKVGPVSLLPPKGSKYIEYIPLRERLASVDAYW